MTLLQEVKLRDVYSHLHSKALLPKTYYEKDEWDTIKSPLQHFEFYPNKNSPTPDY